MHQIDGIIYALDEEIGNTRLFCGRKAELSDYMAWIQGIKNKIYRSRAIFARRKKGKTALVQRLYNVLFTMNDPMIIPFYYKIKEENKSKLDFADELYSKLIIQYLAFKTRDISIMKKLLSYDQLKDMLKDYPEVVEDISAMQMCLSEKNASKAWGHASFAAERISSLRNERIIQILDEFQYLDEYIYQGDIFTKEYQSKLCGTYHHVGASKIAPIIVTGSYITWLLRIINRMTGRYNRKFLKNLSIEESLEAVYTYSQEFGKTVTEESAAYIAKVTEGDVFYISRMFETDYEKADLTNLDSIDNIIIHETRTTVTETGDIAGMWLEYLDAAIDKVNDRNAKRIILYLAKFDKDERTRDQINQDLELNMPDHELSKKLDALIKADIISYGSSRFDYKGLGDKFFNIVFRNMYQKEIDLLITKETRSQVKHELKSLHGQISYYKGLMTEYAVINRMLFAVMHGHKLSEMVAHHIPGFELNRFSSAHKHRITLNQSNYIEVDVFISAYNSKDSDYVIEVKNWKTKITNEHIEKFIKTKNTISPVLKPNTGFIFYSHNPLNKTQEELLLKNQIMPMYAKTLIDNKALDKQN